MSVAASEPETVPSQHTFSTNMQALSNAKLVYVEGENVYQLVMPEGEETAPADADLYRQDAEQNDDCQRELLLPVSGAGNTVSTDVPPNGQSHVEVFVTNNIIQSRIEAAELTSSNSAEILQPIDSMDGGHLRIDDQQPKFLLQNSDGTTIPISLSDLSNMRIQVLQPTDDPVDQTDGLAKQQGPPKTLNVTIQRRDVDDEDDDDEIQPPLKKGPFKCPQCDRMFPKWQQLQRHKKEHLADKPHRCSRCPASFNFEVNLRLHEVTHTEGRPTCPECKKLFNRMASYKAHIMMHEQDETLICGECGDEFLLESELKRHMGEHQLEASDHWLIQCGKCGEHFRRILDLKAHQRSAHKPALRKTPTLTQKLYRKYLDRSHFPQKCKTCGKAFKKPSQLLRHERIHTGEKPFVCHICDKAFNQKGSLQIHMTKHSGEKRYMCEYCPQVCAQKGNLRAHIIRVHSQTNDPSIPQFKCSLCACVYRKLGSLNAHMSRVHTTTEEVRAAQGPSMPPSVVSKKVTDVIQQLLELSAQAEGGQQNLLSEEQQQALAEANISADILQQALDTSGLNSRSSTTSVVAVTAPGVTMGHTLSVPNTSSISTTGAITVSDTVTGNLNRLLVRNVGGVRWHQCTYCSKEFKKPSDLVRHIRVHTHEKPYKCNQCFRSFAVQSTLKAHQNTHTGVKNFLCPVCQKLFATQGSLKVHLRLHTGARPFQCPHCDKTFRTSAHRKSHMVSHTRGDDSHKGSRRLIRGEGKENIDVSDVPLQEPILITDTGLIQQLPRNSAPFNEYLVESSTMDRPYKCQYCSRGFKKSSHLKQHVRSHTGEKPYKCYQCNKRFVSTGVLKSHIRTHTGVKSYRCVVCDAKFTTNGSLKRHMSTHSEVRPFMCPYCQKTFKTAVNCKKHIRTHRVELALQAAAAVNSAEEPDSVPMAAINVSVTADQDIEAQDISQVFDAQKGLDQTSLTEQNHQTTVPADSITRYDFTQQDFAQQLQDQLEAHGHLQQPTLTLDQATLSQLDAHSTLANLDPQAFSAGQFTIQTQDGTAIDVSTLSGQLNNDQLSEFVPVVSMASTNMQNILEVQQADTAPPVPSIEKPASPPPSSLPPPRLQQNNTNQGRKKLFECSVCGKEFKKSSHLKDHHRSHTGEKPYKCNECDKYFITASVLTAHKKTHTGSHEYVCTDCNAAFTTNGSLTRHMALHKAAPRMHQCTICSAEFRNLSAFTKHQKTHEEDEKQVQQQPAKEKRVIVTIHEEAAKELTRKDDGNSLSLSESVLLESTAERNRISEVKDVDKEMEKLSKMPKFANQCQSCPKSFKKPSDLVRHNRIHTGEKPYTCKTCDKRFTVKSTLECHKKTHTGDKNFFCHVCNSTFSTKGSLKVHMRLHTGAKPFKCPHCDECFRTSGHRKSHIAQHLKQKIPKSHRQPKVAADYLGNLGQVTNGQLAEIDPNTLQQITIPVALSVGNDENGQTDNAFLSAPNLQMFEGGIQLQLSATGVGGGIQISGLDSNILNQTIQIDANMLQQLQQQGIGNANLTINPWLLQNIEGSDRNEENLVLNIDTNYLKQAKLVSQQSVPESDSVQNDISHNGVQHDTSEVAVSNPTVNEVRQSAVTSVQLTSAVDAADTNLVTYSIAPINPDRQFQCEMCNKAFKRSGHLKEHLMTHLPSVSRQKNTPHKCLHCGKSFGKPSQLERHIRIHTGERPFECGACHKRFNQKNALQIHLKKHTGEKPYNCGFCQMSFTQKGNLKVHIKRSHPDALQDQNGLVNVHSSALNAKNESLQVETENADIQALFSV